MSRWLSSVVGQLDGAIETREKKLFSAVVLSMILYKLTQLKHKSTSIKLGGRDQFNLDQVITLLEMLVLDPDIDRKECTEYDFLLGMLSEQRLVHHIILYCVSLLLTFAVFNVVIK